MNDYEIAKSILKNLQKEWNDNNDEYSEDGFKEYIEAYCEKNFHNGYFWNGEENVYIVDFVLWNIDLSR